jgi:NAD(P)-dependent dehydrogenase (short-subunit alcohol dehydrogenase family)
MRVTLRRRQPEDGPERTLARRSGEPNGVAGIALFLASDASRYVTGQTLVFDGVQRSPARHLNRAP